MLLLGLGVLAVANTACLAVDRTAERLALEVALIAGTAAFFRMARRLRKMLITGTVVSWLVAVSQGTLAPSSHPGNAAAEPARETGV